MVPTVPEAFCVKERDPTLFRIYADLFDDKALTSIKDCLTYSNVLCLLRHGLLTKLSTKPSHTLWRRFHATRDLLFLPSTEMWIRPHPSRPGLSVISSTRLYNTF